MIELFGDDAAACGGHCDDSAGDDRLVVCGDDESGESDRQSRVRVHLVITSHYYYYYYHQQFFRYSI